jgi:hypothetical protein
MYLIEVAEVVVVELVANSLDAKASRISINLDSQKKVLTVADNGEGMNSSVFAEYHDFAAGLKKRGEGIGFAGLGAKISFNIANKVVTETRSKSFSGGSNWYFESKRKLFWEDIQPTHLRSYGTRVEVWFRPDAKLPYSSTEDIVRLLYRHYLPLMDSQFLDLYKRMGFYLSDLRFVVNGQVIKPRNLVVDFNLDNVKEFFPTRAGKKYGYGIFGVAMREYPIAPDVCGVLLCTHGKVIKADLFNQFPGSFGPRLLGVVEIPDFVKFLTTSKTDFIRKGKHREFERLYDPIRQEFKSWLKNLGVVTIEITDRDEAIKLERELKKLVEDIPELSEFFGFPSPKNVLEKYEKGSIFATTQEGIEKTFPVGNGRRGKSSGLVDTGEESGESFKEDQEGLEKTKQISRTARRGPKIAFVEAPDRSDLAWVDGNNVVINSGHPSYVKVRSDPATRRLHSLFAIASAVQRFLGGQSDTPDQMFIDRMMAAWGKK